ncbi:MAG: glycosyltransferase [Chloroflexi bacterium]|nr:glycosyltransferase [Chloroflexota bacterium]
MAQHLLDILIPTRNRKAALAAILASLLGQTFGDFGVKISDQTEGEDYLHSPEIASLERIFHVHGQDTEFFKNLPRRGMAHQRHVLLSKSSAPYVLFLDDDLVLEPGVIERMAGVIQEEGCGFVGCAPIGLSYIDDHRPWEQKIEFWEGRVQPEVFETWEDVPWERHKALNAANPYHLQLQWAPDGKTVRYKVAWVGASVLYDRRKLLDVGGYSFWNRLPVEHCGEDVAVQIMLLRRYGGCGILPSGVYHLELPTEVADRRADTHPIIREFLENYRAQTSR